MKYMALIIVSIALAGCNDDRTEHERRSKGDGDYLYYEKMPDGMPCVKYKQVNGIEYAGMGGLSCDRDWKERTK